MSDAFLEATVDRLLFTSADGSWAVVRVTTPEGPAMVVGPLAGVGDCQGAFAAFEGRWEDHAIHGRQFRAAAFLPGSPRTEQGLRLYLASARIPGVGPKLAEQLVEHFGVALLGVLEREPRRLCAVPGIGDKRAEAISAAWRQDAGARGTALLLRGAGWGPALTERVRQRYGDEAFDVVRRDPYRLARDVRGVGFLMADKLARTMGLPEDDPRRVAAALAWVAERVTDDGHTIAAREHLLAGLEQLGVPTGGLDDALSEAIADRRLRTIELEGRTWYAAPGVAWAERRAAEILRDRLALGERSFGADALARAEARLGVQLDPSQRDAVLRAAASPVSVITGGPGTGKTTLVRVLLALVAVQDEAWALASPTGRAAKRLSEATGQPAATLHRLLEFQPGTGRFNRCASQPLEVDGLVIDEASMLDVHLLAAALDALPEDGRCPLVLVGDVDQLPSVGPGQVLRDLIASEQVPIARLDTVHRQAAKSGIVLGARAVNRGEVPPSGEHSGWTDFYRIRRDRPEDVISTLRAVITERLPAQGFDPAQDVQVLAPTRRGPLGTEALNEALREALFPGRGGRSRLAVGDRVVVTRNRYDLGAFNGDVATVTSVDAEGVLLDLDDAPLRWPASDLIELEPAFALTVHKSQGSEYPCVVLVLHRSHSRMLRRNLIYTAITRARRFFVSVGDGRAWERAAATAPDDHRRTTLAARLMGAGPGEDDIPWLDAAFAEEGP